jgi:hypothetical protein
MGSFKTIFIENATAFKKNIFGGHDQKISFFGHVDHFLTWHLISDKDNAVHVRHIGGI